MKRLSKLLLLSLLFLSCMVPASIPGKVTRVIDGDTFILLTADNRQERIRLDGIDTPEKGQDFCEKAKQHLASLIAGKSVRVEYKSKDMYGRILGTVYVGSVNVNDEMIRNGLAWQYKYNRSRKYASLQQEAKANKLNIWSLKNPVSPYDFRKNKRTKKQNP